LIHSHLSRRLKIHLKIHLFHRRPWELFAAMAMQALITRGGSA
jgi:hypothetical protein